MEDTLINTNNLKQTVTLNDIAGYKEEKEEAKKIINIFKNFDKFSKLGISIPKGVILCGRPGVGKTLFAKAIAGEANVPFFEFETIENSSELDTITTIKSLFVKAREQAPSIIFIDELDELVSSGDYISDYSRKFLKILLSEIDGINNNENVMVISTTNNYDKIPASLFRSGRIDRKLELEVPDFEARKEIIDLYFNKLNIKNIKSRDVANKTSNFTGADLHNLVNEALINAFVMNDRELTLKDFEEMIPTIRFKGIKKVKDNITDVVCYHEAGHFVAGYILKNMIGDISVNTYGNTKGNVSYDEFDFYSRRPVHNKEYDAINSSNYKEELCLALGGYAAEKVMLNNIYFGSSSDLEKAQSLIYGMIQAGFFGFEYISLLDSNPSEETQSFMRKLLNEALEEVTKIIEDNKDLVEFIAKQVKAYRELSSKDIKDLLKDFKKKQLKKGH